MLWRVVSNNTSIHLGCVIQTKEADGAPGGKFNKITAFVEKGDSGALPAVKLMPVCGLWTAAGLLMRVIMLLA